MQTLSSCPEFYAAETLGTAMRLPAGRGDCSKARTRKEIFTDGAPEGEADQYFRTGPTGGPHGRAARSLPLSPRLRLTLRPVVSELYRSPPDDERAGRATADASGPRRHPRRAARVQGVRMPCSRIEDPHGDIAGYPAAGYGRFRFRPNIIRHIIIFGVSIRENQALMDTV